jgi:hypothetical protein
MAGQPAEVFVGARLAHLHAITVGVHPADLPDCVEIPLLRGVFEVRHALIGPALPQRCRRHPRHRSFNVCGPAVTARATGPARLIQALISCEVSLLR